jgi:hypothetical protein
MVQRNQRTRTVAYAVALLALVTRTAFVLSLSPEPMKPLRDQQLYLRMGRSVAEGDGLMLESRAFAPPPDTRDRWKLLIAPEWVFFDDPGMGVAAHRSPTAIIEPLYPLFVGFMEVLFPGALFPLRMAQALMGAATALLLFSIGRSIRPWVGVSAGAGFAVYPHFIYYTGVVATETLFIFLQIAALWAWSVLLRDPRWRTALLFGALSGLAFLTRASMLPVAVALMGMMVVMSRASLKTIPSVVLAFSVVTSPWVIRNGVQVGEYRLLPTKGGLNLWLQNNPRIQQLQLDRIGMPIPEGLLASLQCRDLEAFPDFSPDTGEIERNRMLTRRALAYIRCNPRYFAYMCYLRLRWYLRFTGSVAQGHPLVDFFGTASFGLLLCFGFLGTLNGRRHPVILTSLALYIAYLLMHALFHGGIRYRLPADSIFLLPAGYGLCWVLDKFGIRMPHD